MYNNFFQTAVRCVRIAALSLQIVGVNVWMGGMVARVVVSLPRVNCKEGTTFSGFCFQLYLLHVVVYL